MYESLRDCDKALAAIPKPRVVQPCRDCCCAAKQSERVLSSSARECSPQRLWSIAEVNIAQKAVLKYVESCTVPCEYTGNYHMNSKECGDS